VVGAAHADGGGGRAHLVAARVELADPARHRAEGALQQAEDALVLVVALGPVGGDAHPGVGPHGDETAVFHVEVQFSVATGDDALAFMDDLADGDPARLLGLVEDRDIALDQFDLAGRLRRGGGLGGLGQGAEADQQEGQGEQQAAHDPDSPGCFGRLTAEARNGLNPLSMSRRPRSSRSGCIRRGR
jgi:hypothetical protein